MNELVQRLSSGKHEVLIGNRNESYDEIKKRLTDMKYIHITFPNTKGGTELGIDVDTNNCDLSNANFEKGIGKIHIEGTTNLNYCDVRCVVDIDLKTKKGEGCLVIIN